MDSRWTLIWMVTLFDLCTGIDLASFYGGSYIQLPFKEAKSSTDLHFKFRTRLPNALILLVAGSTDYCIVRLDNCRLKININLGAGESELLSQPNSKLCDQQWHKVAIVRKEANLTMQIDNFQRVVKHLPGRFFELNVQYGLFVGGRGNFSEIFFGHTDNFRGCLSELNYNGMPILEQVRLRQLQSVVERITWNCANEFEATADQALSFVEDDAFMILPHNFYSKDIWIEFEMRTIIKQGVLFYLSSHTTKLDYVLVEVFDNNLRLIIKSESTDTVITHKESITDGYWHKVTVHVTARAVELIVDGKQVIDKNHHGHVAELSDSIYVGGVEVTKRTKAMSKGCKSCDVAFKGCLRNIVLSGHKKGLPEAHITEGLLPECVWQYPCLQEPCVEGGVCSQKGLHSFQCQCKDEFCMKLNYTEGYKVFSHKSLATELELLAVEPVEVVEGQSVIISTSNLHMILNYHKYGVKNSGVNFYIVEPPQHGSITIDIWPHEKNSFSLFDIAKDKVYYLHDGSENYQDVMVLEVEFSPAHSFILPGYLQGRFRFSLSASVIPVNDPPLIAMSEPSVLRIVQGEKKVVSSDLFKVQDPDSSPDQLMFKIVDSDIGHLEYVFKEGEKITSFTQEDLDRNMVMYVHHPNATNDSFISVEVSDGISTSPLAKIRVSVSPQYWRLENNTGLTVLHQSWSVISATNLSFTSNGNALDHNIQFYITKGPSYGVIEIEKNVNTWFEAEKFTNNDLKQSRIRYRHTKGKPEFDEFLFRISVDKSAVYTFRLIFAKCSLKSTSSQEPIVLDHNAEVVLSPRYLFHETQPMRAQPTSIHYIIAKAPTYGVLFSSVSKYTLKTCDRFTQEDLISENLKYKFHRKPYSFVNETIQFHVLSPGCNDSKASVKILYHPPIELASRVTYHSHVLRIDEGATSVIDESYLNIKTFTSTLLLNVTRGIEHGLLKIQDNDVLIRNNTRFFTLKELNSKRVYYEHDGGESKEDYFEFVAMSNIENDFLFVGNFTINVVLKNDNSPVRAVDKVFHVVVGAERLLTSNDLKYVDDDIDTEPSQIVYTWRDLSNGDFYRIDNQTTKITRFTQKDLDDRVILFRHKGVEYAKVRIWVSDGEFHTNGVLEIQASAPFIHIHYHKKLVVEQGARAVVTNEHLSHLTNVYASDTDVKYQITKQPSQGKLVFSGSDKVANHFNQNDIKLGLISYVNTAPNANADDIEFRVKCKDAVNIAQLGIWLFPSSYWKPFKLRTGDMVVEESTSAVINKSHLEVSQVNVPPSSINFHIVHPPEYGYVSVLPSNSRDIEPIDVTSFTQEMLNDNKVLYIQSVANKTKDLIYFNITNGIIWQNDVLLKINIIPEQIYVTSTNLSVAEGGVAVLTPAHISVTTDYYKDKIKEYQILQNPKYGCIQVHKKCAKGYSFTHRELVAGVVKYKHDDSENLLDLVKLAAVAQNKQSVSVTLFINVLQVNDLTPTLNVSESLEMWQGGAATITKDMLSAIDGDSPPDKLVYKILHCTGGRVFVKSDGMTLPVQQFTQRLIDNNMVLFKHENGTEGDIDFYVTDGKYTTSNQTFLIKTKAVHLNLHKKSLRVFPLQRKYINSSHLLATTSDPNRTVTYEVILPPSLGRLMIEPNVVNGGLFHIVSTFTQDQLNDNRIFYEHTHPFSDLYANDSFAFNVRAPFVPHLRNEKLNIDISVSSGGLDAYVALPKISVDEGGVTSVSLNLSAVITFLENHAGLRSPIIHGICSSPQHGQVFLQHNRNVTTFTQQQMESGTIHYEHDHSETLSDNLHFSLYLLPGYVLLCNVTIPVTVNPVNDQPFRLVTTAPTFTVVHGENHTIARAELLTEDDDTPPSKLKYDVISGPNEGKLILLPGGVPVTYFTQADIDNDCLVYVHNSSVLKDSFHFRVWDEKFRPQFTLFNIIVLPICINISRGIPLVLQQGSDVAFLSNKQITVDTNVQSSRIRYNVREAPKHGVLYVKDGPSMIFTQNDLQQDSVMYLQTDMTTANDSFKVVAETITGHISSDEVTVSIKVKPDIHMKNFTVVAGEYNKITLNVLDATPLAKLTNSNPRYSVVALPQHAHIHKVIRSSGEKKNALDSVVSSFTHAEIKSGLIHMVVEDVELPWNGIQTKFTFLLAASIFQPAVGELRVNIQTSLDNEIQSTLAGPNDPAGHEGGLHLASPNMTRDYFLILSMVAGVVILGVAVIVIIKYRSLQVDEMNKEACLQARPLARPPETLLAAPSPLSIDGSPMSMTLPQCKVTPLSGNELESYACYPYGNGTDEQHSEEWSCCEASDQASNPKNVMLRRNQYWV